MCKHGSQKVLDVFGVSVGFANCLVPQQQQQQLFLMASPTSFMGAMQCRFTFAPKTSYHKSQNRSARSAPNSYKWSYKL